MSTRPDPGLEPGDERIDRLLAELADRADGTAVDGTADLVRGRRAARRRRGLVVAGAALAVVVALGGTAVVTDVLADDRPGDPADPADVAGAPDDGATDPPSAADLPPQRLLEQWRDVLAEHLDPTGEHLDRRVTNTQSGNGLGTKLGWSVEGSEGLGLVQVFVGKGFGSGTGWPCRFEPGWTCRDTEVDGVDVTLAESDEGIGVGVVRDDGSAASIFTDDLFANNSLVPVDGVDVTPEQLVAALTDPDLAAPTDEQLQTLQRQFERQMRRFMRG